METTPDDLQPALDALPLFPLPRLTFFPGTLLPLHVFEPRYRALVTHCLATHRAMAVPMIEGDDDDENQPKISQICGAGVIVEAMELPDGRFNILLQGRARVRLSELPLVGSFRRARAEVLDDEGDEPLAADVDALHAIVASFVKAIRAENHEIEFSLPPNAPPERAADLAAQVLVMDARVRQSLLETTSRKDRVRQTVDAIAGQHAAIGARTNTVN